MLSKRGIEISSAKTWLDSGAQPEMYNGGLFWGFGGKALICQRLEIGEQLLSLEICIFLPK